MKEYIERASVHSIIERTSTFAFTRGGMHEQVDSLPAADVVEVVRCKDCRYWQDNNGGYPHPECRWIDDETPNADDYCSFGEREEADQ